MVLYQKVHYCWFFMGCHRKYIKSDKKKPLLVFSLMSVFKNLYSYRTLGHDNNRGTTVSRNIYIPTNVMKPVQ